MANVCETRMRKETQWRLYDNLPDLPHEPVLFSQQDWNAARADLVSRGLDPDDHMQFRIQAVGTVKLSHGLTYCRHCGDYFNAED